MGRQIERSRSSDVSKIHVDKQRELYHENFRVIVNGLVLKLVLTLRIEF